MRHPAAGSGELSLGRALLLALLAHLMGLVGARSWGLLPTEAERPLPERPIEFVFTDAPASAEEPPPETRLHSSERHRARRPLSSSVPSRPRAAAPQSPAVSAAAAPPEPPTPGRRPAPEPPPGVGRLFSEEAIARALQGQAAPRPAGPAAPEGVLDFDAKDYEWGPYARTIYTIIKRNWERVLRSQNATPGISGRTRLSFRILRSGQVDDLTLMLPAPWALLDRAALASVELSDPLPPLPEDYPRDAVGVTFTYYYNMSYSPLE